MVLNGCWSLVLLVSGVEGSLVLLVSGVEGSLVLLVSVVFVWGLWYYSVGVVGWCSGANWSLELTGLWSVLVSGANWSLELTGLWSKMVLQGSWPLELKGPRGFVFWVWCCLVLGWLFELVLGGCVALVQCNV